MSNHPETKSCCDIGLSASQRPSFEAAAAAAEGWQPRVDRRASHWSQHFKPEALKDRPNTMEVTCNGVKAGGHRELSLDRL